jgi:DNA-directed RNA polymerase specialized sigma24 family protein
MGVSLGSKKRGESSTVIAVTDNRDPKQLEALAERLFAFARRFAAIKRWWLGEAGVLAKGNTVEDVVRTALVSLYGGKRRWDPIKYPDPWVYLVLFVKTELLNLSASSENRLSGRDVDDDALITTETPEDLLLQAHEDAGRSERVARAYSLLIDELGNDAELLQLHDLIINEDIHKPKQLAERLGVSVKDVNNLKKRFWRACRRVLAILEKEQTDD